MKLLNRKEFLQDLSLLTAAALLPGLSMAETDLLKKSKMKLGLVTYLWGKDWDVPMLIKNCTASGIGGVELRVDHAHKVMPNLSAAERLEVKKKFADSPVKIVGMGTNEQYDSPDPAKLKANIDRTKEFIKLSADIGGSGVKVKPNQFHKGVPHQQTLEQIGRALGELGKYAADYGQQIRLEVHGNETQELPNIKTIMDFTDSRNSTVCWNCNQEDLIGQGLEYNFNLVKDRFGDTVHVRELDDTTYPYQELMNLFKKMNYKGWILLECRTDPKDKVQALIDQRKIFEKMLKA
ncbi:sugar phosphate isomerase/epimerase family protein [Arundinibacter roseus]|uniref:Sugar phosphate isomerase/epimerase n=1 Tax=Arundinibacter roseus TaxID=2070510 RepID=A0A4R4K6I2_9BACT|nr:TIM barrel protein [Arundinibacter roseus]TDB62282.1 sugar phosphate isomerase/epimerase [Arundinibacter roseus]